MSTATLPRPSAVRDWIKDKLPRRFYGELQVTPRDKNGRRCAAISAEWYEVAIWHANMGEQLDELEALLRDWPGCVRTTQVYGFPAQVRDPDWPGWRTRRDRARLRPQVLALIADPPDDA